MSTAGDAGVAFRNFLGNALSGVYSAVNGATPQGAVALVGRGAQPAAALAAPVLGDFVRGAATGDPLSSTATVQLPAARPVAVLPGAGPDAFSPNAVDAHNHAQAMTAQDIVHLGKLSPAAQAVLHANAPLTLAAAQAAQSKASSAKAAVPDMGPLSFRQALALSQIANNTQDRGPAPRLQPASDKAADMLSQINQAQFAQSMKEAGDDPAKKQAAINEFRKQQLPIALKNPMAGMYDPSAQDGSQ